MLKTALWHRHPVLHGLLGLTPLLTVTTRVVDALLFGVLLTVILLLTSTVVALLPDGIAPATRLLAVLIVSAGIVSICSILSQAWLYSWHESVGIYLPLLATSCLVLAWLEQDAMTRPLPAVMTGALGQGLAVLWLLVVFALIRELLGRGSVLTGLAVVPGMPTVAPLFSRDGGLLSLLAEPAGGMLLLGFTFAFFAARRQDHPAAEGGA